MSFWGLIPDLAEFFRLQPRLSPVSGRPPTPWWKGRTVAKAMNWVNGFENL